MRVAFTLVVAGRRVSALDEATGQRGRRTSRGTARAPEPGRRGLVGARDGLASGAQADPRAGRHQIRSDEEERQQLRRDALPAVVGRTRRSSSPAGSKCRSLVVAIQPACCIS